MRSADSRPSAFKCGFCGTIGFRRRPTRTTSTGRPALVSKDSKSTTPRRCRRSLDRKATDAENRCQCRRRERPTLSAAILFSGTVSHRKDRGFFPRTRQIGKFPIPIRKRPYFVRDTQPFFEARFSCREPRRFVGIALDQAIAARMA